jgi:precorrin-2 dehydrogenase/sirohydrochlorin ferrochelatase
MRYYPVFLDIAGKPVVVIGGGNIALGKVEGLLDAGADVTVISPELDGRLREFVSEGRIVHVKREYEEGDLQGFALAFGATDDRAVNARVTGEARERGVLVNAVDDPPSCDFIMPGIIRRGELIVAISTSGGSPAMARKFREDVEAFFTEADGAMLDLVAEVRKVFRENGTVVQGCARCGRAPNDIWNAALDAEVKRLLAGGDREGARERLVKLLLAPGGADTDEKRKK